ncbi:MAG: 30S ribosomal protein S3, partial [Candidatus Bathyarchaeota archaeon]|nr:30S ribosomal protein S3 [Candidatus Bathyarchaeota archaeon]
GFWALKQIMEAGALGAEITISGKLRTDRARYEKFRDGYLPKSGEPARKYMRAAVLDVQLKPGILGVKVRLMPPEAKFPDKIEIIEEIEEKPAETEATEKEPTEPARTETETTEIETTETKATETKAAKTDAAEIEPTKTETEK